MDKRFDEINLALFNDQFPESIGSRQNTFLGRFSGDGRVRVAIEKADSLLRRAGRPGLRSDAKGMLLINFRRMVDLPLAAHGDATYRTYSNASLEEDMIAIARAVSRTSKHEVSAHAIIDALSTAWLNFKLCDIRLWGALEEFSE